MNNIKIGSSVEKEVSSIFRKYGFWSHIMQLNVAGQPVDIIAARRKNENCLVYLVDAKHVRGEEVSFPLARIESNQWSSLDYARNFSGLQHLGFAIKFDRTNTIYWLSYDKAFELKSKNAKSINYSLLPTFEEELENASKN